MKIALFEHPDRVGVEELQQDLLQLPPWRKRKALSYRRLIDQVQCAKAYILLRNILAEEYGMEEMPDFEYDEYGKPQLRWVHFNMSHCCKGVMCVVDSHPVGCDIEVIPEVVDADLLDACFCSKERECILAALHPQVEFACLWTRKEALLKLVGIGLTDDLANVLTSGMAKNVVFSTQVCVSGGYVYTIAQFAEV